MNCEIRYVMGHVEVYQDGDFLFSPTPRRKRCPWPLSHSPYPTVGAGLAPPGM